MRGGERINQYSFLIRKLTWADVSSTFFWENEFRPQSTLFFVSAHSSKYIYLSILLHEKCFITTINTLTRFLNKDGFDRHYTQKLTCSFNDRIWFSSSVMVSWLRVTFSFNFVSAVSKWLSFVCTIVSYRKQTDGDGLILMRRFDAFHFTAYFHRLNN